MVKGSNLLLELNLNELNKEFSKDATWSKKTVFSLGMLSMKKIAHVPENIQLSVMNR